MAQNGPYAPNYAAGQPPMPPNLMYAPRLANPGQPFQQYMPQQHHVSQYPQIPLAPQQQQPMMYVHPAYGQQPPQAIPLGSQCHQSSSPPPYASSSDEMEIMSGNGLLEEDLFALDRLFSWYCSRCGQSMMEGFRHHCNTCGVDVCSNCFDTAMRMRLYPHEHTLTAIPL
jgi:hypothetical protein